MAGEIPGDRIGVPGRARKQDGKQQQAERTQLALCIWESTRCCRHLDLASLVTCLPHSADTLHK